MHPRIGMVYLARLGANGSRNATRRMGDENTDIHALAEADGWRRGAMVVAAIVGIALIVLLIAK